MIPGEPSRTAWSVAMHRAAHQIVDGASVFADPVAVPITGWPSRRVADEATQHPERRPMRAFIAARHQFARQVVQSVARPADGLQVVVLGAGLDTTAYQPDPPTGLHVFEVDHPATGAWKRDHLARERIAPTTRVDYVGVDLESEPADAALHAAGLDPSRPVAVMWLGVLVYLTGAAVESTIAAMSRLSDAGVDLILDYPEPADRLSEHAAAARAARARRVAGIGEPWLSSYTPTAMSGLLQHHGFGVVEDLDSADWVKRYFGIPRDRVPGRGGAHLVHAATQLTG